MLVVKEAFPPMTYSDAYLGICRYVNLHVSSDAGPISAYIVDRRNYERLLSEQAFEHHGPGDVLDGFWAGTVHLPNRGPWWLLVENPTEREAQIGASYQPFG